jgi:hypothetical protein
MPFLFGSLKGMKSTVCKFGVKEKLYTVADRKTFLLPPCLADKAKTFLLPLYPLCKIPVA